MIVQLLGIVLPVITTPYVTRVLGNENLGVFSYAQSILNYFVLFGCIGLNTYSQREIAACNKDIKKQSKVFYEVLLVRVVSVTISGIVYWGTIVRTADYPLYYALFGLELFAALVDVSWFLQGNENFKSQAIRALVTRLLGLVCIFLFVKSEADLYIYILCCSGAILAGNLSLWGFIKKSLCPVAVKELRPLRHIRGSLALFLPQVAVNVYTQLDKTMIGLLTNHNYDEVGFYSQAEKIVKIAMTVVTSLGGVMLSRVTISMARKDDTAVKEYIHKSLRFVFLLAYPISVGLAAVCADMVPWFFGPGYDPAIPCMAALSPLVLIIGTGAVFGHYYMIPAKRMKEYTITVVCGMLVNVLFNCLLIPKFGSMGAVVATLLAETTVAASQYWVLRKLFSAKMFLSGSKNLIAAAIMGLCVYAIAALLPAKIWATVIEVGVGGMVYFAVLLILKDQFFLENVKRLLRKCL